MENRLIHSFLEDPEHREMYENYLQNPNETNKKLVEEKFKLHVMKIKVISYFSKVLFFEAQRFDKKLRANAAHTLPLLDDDSEDEIATNTLLNSPIEIVVGHTSVIEDFLENEHLFNLVSNLNDKNKELLYLLYIKELDEDQVAVRLGVTKQAVNKRKNNLLKKLRELYFKQERKKSHEWNLERDLRRRSIAYSIT